MLTIGLIIVIAIVAVIVFKKANTLSTESTAIAALITACFAGMICIALCANAKINEDIDYQNAYYHKATLEYRLENIEKNNVGNEHLYNDIVEFNNSLRSTKKWANNPWTNWFNNQRIAELDYIELPVS